jgi:hypothetical protein
MRALYTIPEPDKTILTIMGKLYKVVNELITEGNIVFDRLDGTYGTCEMISLDGKTIAMRDGIIVEVGIPVERVYNLKEITL